MTDPSLPPLILPRKEKFAATIFVVCGDGGRERVANIAYFIYYSTVFLLLPLIFESDKSQLCMIVLHQNTSNDAYQAYA
jgi:hypothetical protein